MGPGAFPRPRSGAESGSGNVSFRSKTCSNPTPLVWAPKMGGGGGSWFGVILGSKRLSQTLSLRTWVWKWRLSSKNLFQPPIWALKMGVGNRGFGLFWVPGAFRRPPFSSRNLGLGRLSLENVGKPVPTPPPIWALKMRLGIGVSGTFSRPPFSSREPGSGNGVGNRGFGLIWVRKHPYQTPHSRFGGWGSGFGV